MNSWDERYAPAAYFYGTEPNDFLQSAVIRLIAGVQINAAANENAGFVLRAGDLRYGARQRIDEVLRGSVTRFKTHISADVKAGVGSRNVEEAGAVGVANFYIGHGRRLACGQIGSLSRYNSDQCRGSREQKALNELIHKTTLQSERHA